MSDGLVHAKVATTLLIVGAAAGAVAVAAEPDNLYWIAPALIGMVNGWLVTPDIDQNGSTTEETRYLLIPLIGRILFVAFATYWYPYALLFKHRGWSHVPVFGTMTRFGYEVVVNSILFLLLEGNGIQDLLTSVDLAPWMGFYLLGWMVQDFGHLIFDIRLVSKITPKVASRRRVRARKSYSGSTLPRRRLRPV